MGYTTVRTHMRQGYTVRAHARHTSGRHIADILQRDLDRVFEQIDQQGATEQISSADRLVPDPAAPAGYAIRGQPDTGVLLHGLRGESASR